MVLRVIAVSYTHLEKEQNHYYESIAWYFISLLSFYNEDKQKAMKACGQGLKLCESADNVR